MSMRQIATAIAAKYENKGGDPAWPEYGDLVEFKDQYNGRVYQGFFFEYAPEYGPTYAHVRRMVLYMGGVLLVNDRLSATPEEIVRIVVRRRDWIDQMCKEKTMDEMSAFIHLIGVNKELEESMLIQMIKNYRRKVQ